jgi:RNA polymerase sigma factor (sigma-70 family)
VPAPDASGPIGFPPTRESVVEELGSDDPAARARALEAVVTGYWKPVYKYLRVARRVPDADAQDLTQDFFTNALLKDTLAGYDPARARFRTFLRVCLDRFAINAAKAASRLKRGGGLVAVPLDFAEVERGIGADLDRPPPDPEEYFRREWVRSLFETAVAALEAELEGQGKRRQFEAFVAYDIEAPAAATRPTYEAVGARVGLSVTQVTNALAAARRAFRRLVLQRLRELSGSEEEFAQEAREILGVEV